MYGRKNLPAVRILGFSLVLAEKQGKWDKKESQKVRKFFDKVFG
ncbi:hypothetical protein [Anaerotignum sp.]